MLRVELHDSSNTTMLRVEGRFVGAFAQDTRAMLLRCKLKSTLVVDLSEMTFVDAEGEEVLSWLAQIGVRFVATSCYPIDVCERLQLPILKRRMAIPRAHHEEGSSGPDRRL